LSDRAVNEGENAMADPVFTELVQRIRKHFFTQSALD
jgi:NitT/TauT family transport system ATP-binding protein